MEQDQYIQWRTALHDGPAGRTYRRLLQERNEQYGAFLEFAPEVSNGESLLSPEAPRNAGPLAGIPCAVKDNIAVEGFHLSCASRSLADFISPYTATAVRRLQTAGAVVIGKTNLDEFGMGSSTDTSAIARTHNPWDPRKSAGGSSGGSAAAVAAGMVPYALGSDTGGSVRQPAAFCGLYGLKPSYGRVSRHGLVAYASSLESIGILSADLALTRSAFETMSGPDPRDHTSADTEPRATRTGDEEASVRDSVQREETDTTRIGVLTGIEGLSPAIAQGYRSTAEALKTLGCAVQEVQLPSLEYVVPAYYTIAAAEASSNLARYTGIRYGYRNEGAEDPRELVETSRDESLGAEVKLRILLGTYVLRAGFQEEYYQRAQKIRTAIRRDFERLFGKVDLLMMPVYPVQAFDHDSSQLDSFTQKLADKFTAAANLAGLPALAFPTGNTAGLPVGMQLIAPMFHEERLFHAAESYRRIWQPRIATSWCTAESALPASQPEVRESTSKEEPR